jgi:iron(III) transport system ATP-binding protein
VTPVSIVGVGKSYDGRTPVLAGIDLHIAAGELFFLLGGSGCGKTTLLRLIAGFHQPDAGVIRFGDRDMTAVPTERRQVGMVFQNYALWPHLSVAGNIAFPLEVQGVAGAERTRRIDEALALVELSGYGTRRIGELSGGQQQRVALARAIVAKPQVLLLDEPLSNLDARLRGEMRRTIRRVCKAAGVTAVYVTHDQAEALSTADRIALMAKGRIEQLGTPRELYDRPVSEIAARFLGEANILDGAQLARLVPGCALRRACLRPERIRIADHGIPAIITAVSYEGDRGVWTVQAAGDITVTVSEADPPQRRDGDAVQLAIDPAHLVEIP